MILGVCFNGCFDFGGLSVSNRFSYAEADNWSDCDSSDLVTAFRYYCKSRNLAIEGSFADALTSFTTATFNNICSTLGIDPTSLQAELKKTTQGNLGLRFLFSNTGITAYNRIFAEFLQNNDLSVGDEVDNKVLDSSKYFTSLDGYSCKVFIVNGITSVNDSVQVYYVDQHPYQVKGTFFYYSYNDVLGFTQNVSSPSIRLNENVSTVISITYESGNPIYKYVRVSNNSNYATVYSKYSGTLRYCGYPCIILGGNNKLYLGGFAQRNGSYYAETIQSLVEITNGIATDENVYVTTNNTTINNNVYNNNYTIIYNQGDTYISDDDEEPLPSTPPGGGGGGDDPGTDPDDPLDPYDPDKQFPDTPDNPTTDPGIHGGTGSDGVITIPDFNFDIPDINWSLDGLQYKFPFSLPFDLYNCCKLLNAEPETPELDYTINLVVYDWRVNYDLHWLDPAARVIRIFELLAFVVGLILITRRLIGG